MSVRTTFIVAAVADRGRVLLAAVLLLAAAAIASVRADVTCPAAFGDHMVLQRDKPVAIWGAAQPAEAVVVEFGGQTVETKASSDGSWLVRLAPMPANADSRSLIVRGASNTVTFSDVLVGDVWFCSGQSNMEKPFGPRKGQKPTDDSEQEIRNADHPLIRLYQMPQHGRPQKNVSGFTWMVCSPDSIVKTQFSAVGYFFGRELQQELGVPIGLIHSSFGGTQIEAWIPDAAFRNHPAVRGLRDVKYETYVKGLQPTELYESMVKPLVPYTLRGWIWYQGESNCMQADGDIYAEKMRALIDGWRQAWSEPDAPWYYVQIAPFDYSQWNSFPRLVTGDELPAFWEAQTKALAIPHTGMVVTTDLVKSFHDIHPTGKRDVGMRLARLALEDAYGRSILARSPRVTGARVLDGSIDVSFSDVGTGLKTRDGQPASEFLIAGEDRRFVPAVVVVRKDDVLVSSPEVKKPVAVRYAWRETPHVNLVNSADLPAVPFRTDAWPLVLDHPETAEQRAARLVNKKNPAHLPQEEHSGENHHDHSLP